MVDIDINTAEELFGVPEGCKPWKLHVLFGNTSTEEKLKFEEIIDNRVGKIVLEQKQVGQPESGVYVVTVPRINERLGTDHMKTMIQTEEEIQNTVHTELSEELTYKIMITCDESPFAPAGVGEATAVEEAVEEFEERVDNG